MKVADLGVSKSLLGTLNRRVTVAGTPFFMDPRVLELEDDEFDVMYGGYDFKADIWSLGVTL